MINSISSTNVLDKSISKASVQTSDIKKVIKYANGEALTQVPDTFTSNVKSSLGSTALFEGLPLFNLFKRLKKTNGFSKKALNALDKQNSNALKNLVKGDGKLSERIFGYIDTVYDTKHQFHGIKSATKSHAKLIKGADKAVKTAEKALEKAIKNGASQAEIDQLRELVRQTRKKAKGLRFERFTSAGSKQVQEEIVEQAGKQTGLLGKITAPFKKIGNMVKKPFVKLAEKFPAMKKVGKIFKKSGAGFMLALSGVAEFFSEIVPTFKELGFKKGMKQLGKSAVGVLGDTLGFVGGEFVGTAIGSALGASIAGTKIGAAIGSVFPGFGTAIGAVVGCACGMLGSFVMGKVSKAITGKTEREKAKEEQEQQLANQLVDDTQSLEEIKALAIAKLQEESAMNNGKLTGDSLIAFEALQNLDKNNPFAA